MAKRDWRTELGEPDLGIAGFQLWIHGREYPDAQDYHDRNWLRVTAHCGALGASVWAEGAIVQAQDIEFFAQGCEKMRRGEAAEASLAPVEPYFDVELEATDTRATS